MRRLSSDSSAVMPRAFLASFLCVLALAGCTIPASDSDRVRTADILKSSFRPRGQATLERLNQDDVQTLCSRYKGAPPAEVAREIEESQRATVRYPASGKLIGDWRQGERLAQSGVGKQFTDDPARPAGGSCYNCHRLAPKELSYGTVGPSLYQFGQLRGSSEDIQRYAYGKIYNSEAFSACSSMPRFGHNRVLTEEQITHLVAYLLDPASPVNQ
jgi:sulfur-oxidizing protein SoxX